MLDLVRTSIHRVITAPFGDAFFAVRFPKDLARRFNTTLGEPLCSREELARRRAAKTRLAELRAGHGSSAGAEVAAAVRPGGEAEPLPVMIYFEKDRNVRELVRIREVLEARAVPFSALDVSDDEATRAFVMREAKCKPDDLPIVFVAGVAVGGFRDLVEWDVAGKLTSASKGAR